MSTSEERKLPREAVPSADEQHQVQESSRGADWKLFDLRYKNLQSISKAQRVHLSTLLIQVALLWSWYLSGSRDVTVQGLALTSGGVWLATPALLTFFCLAFIGSINAALPAKKKLQEIGQQLTARTELDCKFAFYDLDTDKNVLDYLTFLKVSPTNNKFDQAGRFNIRHFFYPIVMAVSIATTWFAVKGLPKTWPFRLYLLTCVGLQILFSIRPFYRAVCRFVGYDVDNMT
jgi:hypothetical protein